MAIDSSGNLLIADQFNNVIRKISLNVRREQILVDTGAIRDPPGQQPINYGDIAMSLYSANNNVGPGVPLQSLNVSRSSDYAGSLGPTLSRGYNPNNPFI